MTIFTEAVLSNQQLKLFDVGAPQPVHKAGNGRSYFSDPSFATNKTLPIHRWVPWIAGFSKHFVQDALSRYLKAPGTVLDPFSGVGTTLVEALLLGHQGIGFEINPYAVQACYAKTSMRQVDVHAFNVEIAKFNPFYMDKVSSEYVPCRVPPKGFKTRSAFYSPQVERKVLIVQDFIDGIDDIYIKRLFELAFAATMVRYSNYSYEPSLGRRVSAGKPEIHDFAVGRTVLDKLLEMVEDIVWSQAHISLTTPNTQIFDASFFEYATYLKPETVDLIITSPPYLNNYHYNRNTRPQLYWLGHAQNPKDLKPLEHANFGKYWQTVREKELLPLTFSLPDSDLEARLETLRALKPERGIYGGNGWANYAAAYFNDCYTFATAIEYVLKPKATALVVIGNSILQGIMMPTDQYFAQIAAFVGLELVRIDVPRATRVGNSIIKSDVRVVKAKKSHKLYEAIVELRKSA